MLVAPLSAFGVLITLIIAWSIPRKINIKDSTMFFVLVISTVVYLFFDITSTYTGVLDLPSESFFFKGLMISLLFRCFLEFSYLCMKSIPLNKTYSITKFTIIIPIIGSIIVAIFPIQIDATAVGLDVRGLSIDVAYYTALFIFLLTIVYLLIYRGIFNIWNRVCFISTLVMWGIGTLIQLFVEQTGVLSVTFICTLVAIYAFFENPLNYKNYEFNCFKDNYISKYFDYVLTKKQKGYIFVVNILSLNNYPDDIRGIVDFKKQLVAKLQRFKNLRVFYSVENEIVVIGYDSEFESCRSFIRNELDKYYLQIDFKINYRSELIYCKDITIFSNSNEYIMRLAFARNEIAGFTNKNVDYEINYEKINAIKEEERVKAEIKEALLEDRVKAFVQPIYSVEKKKFVSAESLCRIIRSNNSIMLPYQFIPISEKYGLDIPIGYRMFEKVCQILSSSLYGSLFEYIDVNLSIAECELESLSSRIINIVQKYNIEPKRINFEITESGYINKMAVIRTNIKILTDYGFGFSLDDFGSGESNLDYLVKLPVKYLKLDMNMIWAYFESDNAKKTVLSIIKIAHEMGLKVVAEGVETKEQFEELEDKGIDFVQGYYFYKPMSISDYDSTLKNNKK